MKNNLIKSVFGENNPVDAIKLIKGLRNTRVKSVRGCIIVGSYRSDLLLMHDEEERIIIVKYLETQVEVKETYKDFFKLFREFSVTVEDIKFRRKE